MEGGRLKGCQGFGGDRIVHCMENAAAEGTELGKGPQRASALAAFLRLSVMSLWWHSATQL